jgi:hypothetical protein
VNYHTLSDFRGRLGTFLDGLLSDMIAVLVKAGVVDGSTIHQDGTKVRANAATSINADSPSGNAPTTRVRRRTSRLSHSSGLFIRMHRLCVGASISNRDRQQRNLDQVGNWGRDKASRHRPITKNTRKPLKLRPPRVRAATPAERHAAHAAFQRQKSPA